MTTRERRRSVRNVKVEAESCESLRVVFVRDRWRGRVVVRKAFLQERSVVRGGGCRAIRHPSPSPFKVTVIIEERGGLGRCDVGIVISEGLSRRNRDVRAGFGRRGWRSRERRSFRVQSQGKRESFRPFRLVEFSREGTEVNDHLMGRFLALKVCKDGLRRERCGMGSLAR